MLSKNKEAKKAAISKLAAKQRQPFVSQKKNGGTKQTSGNGTPLVRARDVAIPEGTHAHSAGEELMKQLGENINTRLQEISAQELADLDEDVDVFDEKKRELMEAARLAAGTRQRAAAAPMRAFLKDQEAVSSGSTRTKESQSTTTAAASLQGLHAVRIGHNANSVTAVAALGLDVVVLGDKSGKVYLANLVSSADDAEPSTSSAYPKSAGNSAVRPDEHRTGGPRHAYPPQHRKVLLFPVMASGVLSLAISDTRDAFASMSARQLFEKTTVDTSCTSYIAAGCVDGSISIWETATRRHKGLLWLHRKPVTSLHFRPTTSTLLSVSKDHTLRVWSVPQMMAMDQLFGHDGSVFSCDSLRRNVCATVGDDGTMRYWKLDVATQQAYTYVKPARIPSPSASAPPTRTSLEAVAMLNESIIIAGSQDGSLIVFDINRRRPLMVQTAAHGYDFVGDGTGLEKVAVLMQQLQTGEDQEVETTPGGGDGTAGRRDTHTGVPQGLVPPLPNPITALAAVPYADVFASASYDGVVRLWELTGVGSGSTPAGRRRGEEQEKDGGKSSTNPSGPELRLLAEIPVPGLVNALRFSWSGDALFVGVAKEPKSGRWVVQQSALNSVFVIPLSPTGLSTLKAAGEIQHIPAQLFGLKDLVDDDDDDNMEKSSDDEEEENEENEEENARATRRAASRKTKQKTASEEAAGLRVSENDLTAAPRLLQVDKDGAMVLNQSLARAVGGVKKGKKSKQLDKSLREGEAEEAVVAKQPSSSGAPPEKKKKKKENNNNNKAGKKESGIQPNAPKEQRTLAHSKVLKKKKKIMK